MVTLTRERVAETPALSWDEEFQRLLDAPADPQMVAAIEMWLDGQDGAQTVAMQSYDLPSKFIRTCIRFKVGKDGKPGEAPTDYQLALLDEFWLTGRMAVRGPRGMGKSAMAAWLIVYAALYWEAQGIDWKIVTTAAVYRQLKNYLWREVRKWAARIIWEKVGMPAWGKAELQSMSIVLTNGDATAAAAANNDHIEGAHATAVLFLIDEAKAVPDSTFDSIEGTFMNADRSEFSRQMIFAISTPGSRSGRFSDICHRRKGLEDWTAKHVTLQQAIESGQISGKVAAQRLRQWGERSSLYQNQILGEFSTDDDDGVIPLSWVEAAITRWEQLVDEGVIVERTNPNGGRKVMGIEEDAEGFGVDVGDSGPDQTIVAPRWDNVIGELHAFGKGDPLATADTVLAIANAWGPQARLVVDAIGVGSGTVAALRRYKADKTVRFKGEVVGFNAGEAATYKKGRKEIRYTDASGTIEFQNRRAHAWWNMRELLDPQNEQFIALPPDDEDELLADLTIPRYDTLHGGRIGVESKDSIKERLSRSTDRGDAVVQAFYPTMELLRATPVAPLPTVFGGDSNWVNPFGGGGNPFAVR